MRRRKNTIVPPGREGYISGCGYVCVRIYLDNLNQPEEASRVVQLSQSIEGAKMVARYHSMCSTYV